jgi:hypothetical protein
MEELTVIETTDLIKRNVLFCAQGISISQGYERVNY